MSNRYVDISQLTELSRREMLKAILDKRDATVLIAARVCDSAINEWHNTAPIKTGQLRNSVSLSKHKYTAGIHITDDRFRLVNILNSKRHTPHRPHGWRTAGFYDKFKRKYIREFQKEAETLK